MKIRALRSSPLHRLADSARDLSRRCDELWVATAFVSDAALRTVVETAVDRGAKGRFLTGTFGSLTRLRTFRRVARLAVPFEARVWRGDFHAKMYLWRLGREAVAWVGSANLTDRGLTSAGELMVELRGPWASPPFAKLRTAYDAEWALAKPIDAAFLSRYREAPRASKLLGTSGRARAPRLRQVRISPSRAMIVVSPTKRFEDGSAVVRRVDALLGEAADTWYRAWSKALKSVRRGHYCLVVDPEDRTVSAGVVTDTATDGSARVFAYDLVGRARPLTAAMRKSLVATGLSPTGKAFRTAWLRRDHANEILDLVLGARARQKLEATARTRASHR